VQRVLVTLPEADLGPTWECLSTVHIVGPLLLTVRGRSYKVPKFIRVPVFDSARYPYNRSGAMWETAVRDSHFHAEKEFAFLNLSFSGIIIPISLVFKFPF
jgi:hypothetical protein